MGLVTRFSPSHIAQFCHDWTAMLGYRSADQNGGSVRDTDALFRSADGMRRLQLAKRSRRCYAGSTLLLPRRHFSVEEDIGCWFSGGRAAVERWASWVEQGQEFFIRGARCLSPGRADWSAELSPPRFADHEHQTAGAWCS